MKKFKENVSGWHFQISYYLIQDVNTGKKYPGLT
jgi:hypothetical protein